MCSISTDCIPRDVVDLQDMLERLLTRSDRSRWLATSTIANIKLAKDYPKFFEILDKCCNPTPKDHYGVYSVIFKKIQAPSMTKCDHKIINIGNIILAIKSVGCNRYQRSSMRGAHDR